MSSPTTRFTLDSVDDVPDDAGSTIESEAATLVRHDHVHELYLEQVDPDWWFITALFDDSVLDASQRGDIFLLVGELAPEAEAMRCTQTEAGEFVVRLDYDIRSRTP